MPLKLRLKSVLRNFVIRDNKFVLSTRMSRLKKQASYLLKECPHQQPQENIMTQMINTAPDYSSVLTLIVYVYAK